MHKSLKFISILTFHSNSYFYSHLLIKNINKNFQEYKYSLSVLADTTYLRWL